MKTLVTTIFLLLLPSFHAAEKPGDFILKKLDAIIIPLIDFEDTSVEEAIDYLRVRSIELDKGQPPENRGISFVVRKARAKNETDDGLTIQGDGRCARIDRLQAKDITLTDALVAICTKTGLDAYVTTVGIIIQPIGSELPATFKGHKTEVLKKLTPNLEAEKK